MMGWELTGKFCQFPAHQFCHRLKTFRLLFADPYRRSSSSYLADITFTFTIEEIKTTWNLLIVP